MTPNETPDSLCFPDVVDTVGVESVAPSPVGGFDGEMVDDDGHDVAAPAFGSM